MKKKALFPIFALVLVVVSCSPEQPKKEPVSVSQNGTSDSGKKENKKVPSVESIDTLRKKLKSLTKKARLGQRETFTELEDSFDKFVTTLHTNNQISDDDIKFLKEKINSNRFKQLK